MIEARDHRQDLMGRVSVLWKLEIKRQDMLQDFYNEQGPATLLEPPSEESYKKKIDFERSKLDEWLFL